MLVAMHVTDLDLYCDTGKTCRKPALAEVCTVPALLVIITVTSHTGGVSLSNAAHASHHARPAAAVRYRCDWTMRWKRDHCYVMHDHSLEPQFSVT